MRKCFTVVFGLAVSILAAGLPGTAGAAEPLSRVREGGTPDFGPERRLTPYAVTLPKPTEAPGTCGVASPPEYSPSEGIMIRYQAGGFTSVVSDVVAAVTGDAAYDDVVYVVVLNSSIQATATTEFVNKGADMSKVKFILKPSDSVWLRDYGPHFIWQGPVRTIVDSHYYPERPQDNFIPTLSADDYFREESYDIPVYYSGGNFQPGPGRTGFVTALINLDNPTLTNEQLGALYQRYQGIDTLHIMPKLPFSVDGTGHVDMWMYLVDEDTVIISEFEPGSNQTAIDITNNAVPYMEALGFEVFRTPAKNIGTTHYTYANAFRVNDRIFIPTYGQGSAAFLPLDAAATAAWQAAAGPGVEIVGINSWSIIPAAGAIHCVVMQVPKYTDTIPAGCVNSPTSGEVVVAGKNHEIQWNASDDVAVTLIDLYYSTDGSNYQPITQNLLGNRDDYNWAVPNVESSTGYVKVVARDAASNVTEVISENPFSFVSAVQRVYDFSSGAGVDKHAWGTQTASWANMNAVRLPATLTELSAANYAKLAASDAVGLDTDPNRYITPVPPATWETTHVFEFTIVEDPATILDLGINWEGYGDQCIQMELYVWDYVAGNWSDAGGTLGENNHFDNFAGNRDEETGGHIRSNLDRYINPSGQLTFLLYGERPGQESFHDYVSVTVTHEPCLGPDTDFDGYGNACDNCPVLPSQDQSDADGDLHGAPCDCAPADATAFELPTEIAGLGLDSATLLSWDSLAASAGPGTLYDVLRGDLGDWGPAGYGDTCLVSGHGGVTFPVTGPLAPDSGEFYLVRGANACGTGNYGYDSAGAERTSAVCP